MLTYSLDERGGLPLYEYLYRCIRADILSGAIAAEERLPSKRALAEHLGVFVITVEGAYAQLEAEGYVYACSSTCGAVRSMLRASLSPSGRG